MLSSTSPLISTGGARRARLAVAVAVAAATALGPPAAAHAGSLSLAAPAAGDATVVTGTASRETALRVTRAPKGVAVLGGVDARGRFAIAIVRPRGAGGGGVRLRSRGRARVGARLVGVLIHPATLRADACGGGGSARRLGRVLRAGALA